MNSKELLDKIVDKHIQESTDFWAGKKRMTKEELDAVERFAKEKAEPLNSYFSNPENSKDFSDRLDALCE
jgi:hypothetical protein